MPAPSGCAPTCSRVVTATRRPQDDPCGAGHGPEALEILRDLDPPIQRSSVLIGGDERTTPRRFIRNRISRRRLSHVPVLFEESPPAFRRRMIYTEAEPLRRARMPRGP